MKNMISTNKDLSIQNNSNINPLNKYDKLYLILAFLGGIGLFIGTFNFVGAILGAVFGLGIAWFIVSFISMSKVMKLNFKNYPTSKNITKEELFESLYINFNSTDIKIDKSLLGIIINYKGLTKHTIILNESKKCYSIDSTMSSKSKAKNGMKINSKKLYNFTVQALPVIHKMIEDSINQINHN